MGEQDVGGIVEWKEGNGMGLRFVGYDTIHEGVWVDSSGQISLCGGSNRA